MRAAILACTLLVLSACAAMSPTPCQRECNRVYETCMDAGGLVNNPQAMNNVEAQCSAATASCTRSCAQR